VRIGSRDFRRWNPLVDRWVEDAVRRVLRYDPREDRWEQVAPMRCARGQHAAVALRGRLLVLGGMGQSGWEVYPPQGKGMTRCESYCPEEDAWREEPPLIVGRSEFTCAALP
jgi:hypothetical protein